MEKSEQAGILPMDRVLNTPRPVRKWRPPTPEPGAGPGRPGPKPAGAPGIRKPKAGRASLLPGLGPKLSNKLPVRAKPTPAAEGAEFGPEPRVSAVHTLGLISVSAYLLSAYSNDLMMHAFGGKAYLSWVFGPLAILALVICGTMARAFRSSIGKLWLGFAACLLFSTAFSIAKGESLAMVRVYFAQVLVVYFCCAAFGVTIRNVHRLLMASVICTGMILLEAILFGKPDGAGRMIVPQSIFLGNSNDFALHLVCSLGFSMYLIWQKSGVAKVLGCAAFLLTMYFMLKTGSRGGFLALVGCLAIWFLFSGKRGTIIALLLPGLALIPLVSGATLARLVHIEVPGAGLQATADGEAELSQVQRTHLLETSIRFAVTHPVFGTGPGTFRDALYYDDLAHGTHTPALGTHNSWTQVASECGIPAFLCYACIVFGSIRACYRIMRKTQHQPGAEKVFAMSACLLGVLVAYAISTTFDHVAYHLLLPLFSGTTAALYFSTHGGDVEWIRSQDALGNV
jgi:O-antigen ligase